MSSRKLTVYAGLAALAIAVPAAQANDEHPNNGKKGDPPGHAKPKHDENSQGKKPDKCKPHAVGYNARGTLVSASLTQTKGADTARKGDDRWSGTLTVNVTKASHKAPTGEQTFTLTDARVHSYSTTPAAGSRVKLHGKITKLRHGCDSTGFTPTITVNHVDIKAAKAPKS